MWTVFFQYIYLLISELDINLLTANRIDFKKRPSEVRQKVSGKIFLNRTFL